jgi:hypothetical protein
MSHVGGWGYGYVMNHDGYLVGPDMTFINVCICMTASHAARCRNMCSLMKHRIVDRTIDCSHAHAHPESNAIMPKNAAPMPIVYILPPLKQAYRPARPVTASHVAAPSPRDPSLVVSVPHVSPPSLHNLTHKSRHSHNTHPSY